MVTHTTSVKKINKSCVMLLSSFFGMRKGKISGKRIDQKTRRKLKPYFIAESKKGCTSFS